MGFEDNLKVMEEVSIRSITQGRPFLTVSNAVWLDILSEKSPKWLTQKFHNGSMAWATHES